MESNKYLEAWNCGLDIDLVEGAKPDKHGPASVAESAVRAIHLSTGLSATARDKRSQHRNKMHALTRLASLIKLQEDMVMLTEPQAVHASHDRLERGRTVRRFKGTEFRPA